MTFSRDKHGEKQGGQLKTRFSLKRNKENLIFFVFILISIFIDYCFFYFYVYRETCYIRKQYVL